MRLPNLVLRGSTYWWRRRLTVVGHSFALSLSLRTGSFNQARVRAGLLSAEVEKLRMAYGERGVAVPSETLKRIFSDALRWQLERILQDQIASGASPQAHARVNQAFAELWSIFARADQRWTADDDERLAREGWAPEARLLVADLWLEHRHDGALISQRQLETYLDRFGFAPTSGNMDRVKRTIFAARAAACREATNRLGAHPADFGDWEEAALNDDAPYAFETGQGDSSKASAPSPTTPPTAEVVTPKQKPVDQAPAVDEPARPKKLLTDAMEEAIQAFAKGTWGKDSIEQVRTAIRLFDHACGGAIQIEDITQKHVAAFYQLCMNLPNRWGKTRDEIEHGIPASLAYAERLRASGQGERVGFSKKTVDKHVTWILAVLNFAAEADEVGDTEAGHRPAKPLNFKSKRLRAPFEESDQVRSRDLRLNWTAPEIDRLLDAPIWTGCKDLDSRFMGGTEIIHDAWYWLPLMYILYGGRSTELSGLPLCSTYEDHAIPYFQVDYTDLRALKNIQSVRKLPIHPELIRLGFLDYVREMRAAEHELLFPEMCSPVTGFQRTFYKSVFVPWRSWAFPNGTEWRHQARGAIRDKDIHSFRGLAISLMKGKVPDSVRVDILGHEGENTTTKVYDEEACLEEKEKALALVSSLTAKISVAPLRLRPTDRQKFGARRGARRRRAS